MFKQINKNIIKTLGIDKLPDEQQKEAMERFGGIIYQEIILMALEKMSNEEKDEFEKILKQNADPEIVMTFLDSKIPNLEEITTNLAQKIRDESSKIMEEIGK